MEKNLFQRITHNPEICLANPPPSLFNEGQTVFMTIWQTTATNGAHLAFLRVNLSHCLVQELCRTEFQCLDSRLQDLCPRRSPCLRNPSISFPNNPNLVSGSKRSVASPAQGAMNTCELIPLRKRHILKSKAA